MAARHKKKEDYEEGEDSSNDPYNLNPEDASIKELVKEGAQALGVSSNAILESLRQTGPISLRNSKCSAIAIFLGSFKLLSELNDIFQNSGTKDTFKSLVKNHARQEKIWKKLNHASYFFTEDAKEGKKGLQEILKIFKSLQSLLLPFYTNDLHKLKDDTLRGRLSEETPKVFDMFKPVAEAAVRSLLNSGNSE
jgi:hypothetical protein